jgi:HTH-type transcriptional regulator/antitoxin HipB
MRDSVYFLLIRPRVYREEYRAVDNIARTPQQIGAIIHRQRRHLKLTQTGLVKRIKLRQATISKLESGGPGTRLDTLLDVLAALNLEMVIRPRTKGSSDDIERMF